MKRAHAGRMETLAAPFPAPATTTRRPAPTQPDHLQTGRVQADHLRMSHLQAARLENLLHLVAAEGMAPAEPWVSAVAEAATAAGSGRGVIEALLDTSLPEMMRVRALSHAVAAVLG
jgi:hypothetical protein